MFVSLVSHTKTTISLGISDPRVHHSHMAPPPRYREYHFRQRYGVHGQIFVFDLLERAAKEIGLRSRYIAKAPCSAQKMNPLLGGSSHTENQPNVRFDATNPIEITN